MSGRLVLWSGSALRVPGRLGGTSGPDHPRADRPALSGRSASATRRSPALTDDYHYYEPRIGHGLSHDPFNAIVAPRPIGWVSTQDREGRRNLAPYSFFNAFCYRPPIVGFSSTGRKDSLANAEATGEFCWNLVTANLAQAMNLTSTPAPPEIDEFEVAGLTPEPSRLVGAPHVAQSPVSFECKVSQIVRLTGADGANTQSWMVLGEVVLVRIRADLLTDGVFDTAAARPVTRGGGAADYFAIDERSLFRMDRPSWPPADR